MLYNDGKKTLKYDIMVWGKNMKAITIRGVDHQMSEGLKQAAARESKSVNQFVIDIVKERLGLHKRKRFTKVHSDLDYLFGKWSEKEYQDIQTRIDRDRKIDGELWE